MKRQVQRSAHGRPHRRDLLRLAGLGLVGGSMSGWLPLMADQLAQNPKRRRHCVLLWMVGGPSQTDTFDMKPGHANGGEFREISSSVPGLRLSENLLQLAAQAQHLGVVRSLSTAEGDHSRATYLIRTGRPQNGPVRYPAIGAALAKAIGDEESELPNYVSIAPSIGFNPAAYSSGFLGPRYAAATVGASNPFVGGEADDGSESGFATLKLDHLQTPAGIDANRVAGRRDLWETLQAGFLAHHPTAAPLAHDTLYRRTMRLMNSRIAEAFDLSQESDTVREAYGRGRFGQGCLLARRLIEYGVPFIEVSLGGEGNGPGWDTHDNNFPAVKRLSQELDAGWGSLMRELAERDLLESTTILWMGEFGRTPGINERAGRDHHPAAWSCVFAGGGIAGGQAYGNSGRDGVMVTDGKVGIGDVLATLCSALGVDPMTENFTEEGRPLYIAEGTPIRDLLA